MAELSPAAQAVFYATHKAMAEQQFALSGVPDYRQVAAAALRAAADQVVPLHICGTNATRAQTRLGIRHKLLAIAAELEVQP